MREELIREILDKALTEELGLVITCDNPKATELQINKFKTNQPKYAGLMLCWNSNSNQLLIVQRTVELDDAREPTDERS